MQRDHRRFFDGRNSPPHGYESGGYGYDPSAGAAFDDPLLGRKQHEFPCPLNDVEFQPSDTCPKNFVIFDQTYSRSRAMFHPSLAHKFGSSSFDNYGAHAHEAGNYRGYNPEEADEIDALLSLEDGEEDNVVSTGRTPGYRNGSSPDSSCSSSTGTRANKYKKKQRMKKMVTTLKGIVPGADQMDTPAVLDEAVKYLKSLKVEVKKLRAHGSGSSDS